MKIEAVIDRFEGDYAVLETEEGMTDIHRGHLPGAAREGDVLIYSCGGWSIDRTATEERRRANSERLKRLLRGGDTVD